MTLHFPGGGDAQRGGAAEGGVRIGEALAEARQQAGLTVAEVSRRTRIREAIIAAIEGGDYSACGGHFYARGNIRAIAQAIGADPEPFVREYDAACRPPSVVSAVNLDELLTPAQRPGQRRRNWAAVLGTAVLGLALVVTLGFVGYDFFAGSPHAGRTPPAAGNRAAGHAAPGRASPAPTASERTPRPVRAEVVHLTAARGCWVVFSTPRGGFLSGSHLAAGASHTWTFQRAVDLKLDNPSGVTLAVNGKNPLPRGPAAGPLTLILRPGRPAAVAPSPRLPPRPPSGPVAAVRAYIAAINAHDYARAWNLGGRNTGLPYSDFVAGFGTTARDTLTIVSVSGDLVTARLTAQQADGSTATYQGTYTVQDGVITGFNVSPVS